MRVIITASLILSFVGTEAGGKNIIQKRILNYGDAPEYEKNINILMGYSEYQTKAYIEDVWKLPYVTSNPSIQSWIYDTENTENVVISWCTNLCHYILMSTGNSSEAWKVIKAPDSFEYFKSSDGEGRQPLLAGDARIYVGFYPFI